ncbi:MAG TPA: hypothetical protein VHA75_02610, partial [Rugosimonospora sp.]|nr:hypothetical protein [Rugosimonospora sp.]
MADDWTPEEKAAMAIRDHARAEYMKDWGARLDGYARGLLAGLPLGWGESMEEWGAAQVLLTEAGIPVHHRHGWETLDSRIARWVVPALRRMQRIAQAHSKNKAAGGMTSGDCDECGWSWPCPTYRWATGEGD